MSAEIVAQAKADLEDAGRLVDLNSTHEQARNNAAFLITMEAASRIPGAGVVDKPTGNQAAYKGAFYSVDGIAFQDGRFYDCLVSGGDLGGNRPVYNAHGTVDPSRWRPAVSVLHSAPDQPPVTPGTEPSGSAFASFDQDVRAAIGRMEHTLAAIELNQAAVLASAQASLAVALPDYGGTFTVPAAGKRATLTLKPKKSK